MYNVWQNWNNFFQPFEVRGFWEYMRAPCNSSSCAAGGFPTSFTIWMLCHTRVQLENFSSAWNLAILQVGPRSGMIFYLITTQPPTNPPTNHQVKKLIWKGHIPWGCKTGSWIVSEIYLETGRCLGVSKVTPWVKLWNYNPAWNLAILQVGPRSAMTESL